MIKRIVSWLAGTALGLTLLMLPLHGQAQTAKPFSNEQLEQMTAPIALFPDALLAQLFMATTYPEDFAAAAAWSKAHPNEKGDAAVKMVENQPWDPSVASLVAFPDVLITFGAQPEWVRNMGDAFLAQPEDVMNAVQRLRQRAQQAGNLKSNEQISVSTQAAPAPTTVVVQQSAPPPQVIVIEPAQPSTVFVPAYNPMYVFGPWPYPAYAPFFFPPPPGYWFSRTIATGIAWGIGIGISNALWGGVNWGRGSVNVNVNRYNNINVNRQINASGNRANWNHNPERRGATPYRGGDATRQNLNRQYQAGSREQFRGKDTVSRDASRERAAQTMQQRGMAGSTGSAMDRAQSIDRGAVQQGRQEMNRGGQGAGGRENALAGAGDRQSRQQMDRGAASQQAAQRGGFEGARPAPAGGGGGRVGGGGGGGGGARMGGGGGGRAGGGGRGR